MFFVAATTMDSGKEPFVLDSPVLHHAEQAATLGRETPEATLSAVLNSSASPTPDHKDFTLKENNADTSGCSTATTPAEKEGFLPYTLSRSPSSSTCSSTTSGGASSSCGGRSSSSSLCTDDDSTLRGVVPPLLWGDENVAAPIHDNRVDEQAPLPSRPDVHSGTSLYHSGGTSAAAVPSSGIENCRILRHLDCVADESVCTALSKLSLICFEDDFPRKILTQKKTPTGESWKLHVLTTGDSAPSQRVLGFVAFCVKRKSCHAEIARIAVCPTSRRRGYGRALIRGVVEQLKCLATLRFLCLSALPEAIPFYSSLGFVQYASVDIAVDDTPLRAGAATTTLTPGQVYMEYVLSPPPVGKSSAVKNAAGRRHNRASTKRR